MLCDRCHGREATVHMTQIINGHRTERHLCADCAAEEEVMTGAVDWMDRDWFQSPLESFFQEGMQGLFPRRTIQVDRAPEIGETPLFRKGLRGANESYEAFREKIRPSFQKGRETPTASRDIPVEAEKKEETELEKLEKSLQSCIAREDYERAAVLRDQIKKMKGK